MTRILYVKDKSGAWHVAAEIRLVGKRARSVCGRGFELLETSIGRPECVCKECEK